MIPTAADAELLNLGVLLPDVAFEFVRQVPEFEDVITGASLDGLASGDGAMFQGLRQVPKVRDLDCSRFYGLR